MLIKDGRTTAHANWFRLDVLLLHYWIGFERKLGIMQPVPPVNVLGVEYPALADGKYDAVILGTGLKECIVAGLLATEGKKVGGFRVFLRNRFWFWIAMTTMEAIAHL